MNLKGGDFMSLPASELEIRLQKVRTSYLEKSFLRANLL